MPTPEPMSEEEGAIIGIVRLNRALPKREWKREVWVGRLRLQVQWRAANNLWGRFGGGWQWALGFVASRSTLILNLLVMTLRVDWTLKRPRKEADHADAAE